MQKPQASTHLEAEILDRLVQAQSGHVSPVVSQWHAVSGLRSHFRQQLGEHVRRIFDNQSAERTHRHYALPGATRDDYKNHWLELPDLGHCLTGIRFRDLEPGRPFVDVLATTLSLGEATNLQNVVNALQERYRQFRPQHARFFVPSCFSLNIECWPGAFWELCYLAAPAETLLNQAEPEHYQRVVVRRPWNMTFYSRYRQMLEHRFTKHPELAGYTRIASIAELKVYLDDGTLFEVFVDGDWAGIVGVTDEAEQGLDGLSVVELVLSEDVAGRGLGVVVLRHMAEILSPEGDTIIFGTVDARNIPAIKTARRAGGIDVGGYLWFPF